MKGSHGLKPKVIERKAYWLIAASLWDYGLIREWTLDDGVVVELPFHSFSEPYRVWRFKSTPGLGGGSWIIKFSIDGSGLLYINGKPYSGLDNAHTYVIVDGSISDIVVEATPPTIHGVHNWGIKFNYALYSRVAVDGFIVGLRLLALYDYVNSIRDEGLRREILSLAEEVLSPVNIRASHGQLAVAGMILHDSYWSPWTPRKELPHPRFDVYITRGLMGEGVLSGVIDDDPVHNGDLVNRMALDLWSRLEEGLAELKAKYRVEGVIHTVGHSHMDSAWLWPIEEAKRKVIRTNATVAYLASMRSDVIYIQSPAIHHHWLRDNTEVLEAVNQLARRGRWIPVGGMWVEGELQVVDGESIARQLLYGQRYYKETFGITTTIGWLPDNFGYPASLPQLLVDAGIKILFIQKVLWNDSTRFPYHLFLWEGIDGSQIPVQVIPDNVYAYNNPARPSHILEYWSNYNGRVKRVIYPYGYGDGGGGPTLEMIVNIDVARILPGLPAVVEGGLEELEEDVTRAAKALPRIRGELYLELHRGSYTTNARIKELTSKAESLLRSLDILEAMQTIKGHKHNDTRDYWKTLLLMEFHDILPGTGIKEVYDDAEKELGQVIEYAEGRIKHILHTFIDETGGCGLLVYNDASWPRSGVVSVDGYLDGCQRYGDSCLVYVDQVPPLGYAIGGMDWSQGEGVRVYERDGRFILDNGVVKAVIRSDTLLESLSMDGVEYLSEPSNRILAHIDEPAEWDAWDVEREAFKYYEELEVLEPPRITARGLLRSCVSYMVGRGDSWIRQDVCLDKGSPTLDYYTRVRWRERQVLLKAWFNPSIPNPRYYFEVPFGYIERGVDELRGPKFESPMLRWMAVQGEDRGLAIISASRHGVGYLDSGIGLSLLKRPLFPNPWSDDRIVELSYSIYPYKGSLEEAGVSRVAFEKWSPLKAIYRQCRGDTKPPEGIVYSLFNVEPSSGLIMSTVKVSEDGEGLVMRLYNPTSRWVKASIKVPSRVKEVYVTNVTELISQDKLNLMEAGVKVGLGPFKLLTLKFIL